jgi:hypothetical protein
VYEHNGFRIAAPPGWSERTRAAEAPSHSSQDRLLVQYKRLTAGHPAWLRVGVADVPGSVALAKCLATRSPGKGWKQTGKVETLEVSGLPALQTTYAGQLQKKDYVSEIVAVRHAEHVYFFTATYPATDEQARDHVREAVAGSSWQATTVMARR